MDPLLLLRETISSDAGITLLSITDNMTTEVTSLSLATHISFPPSSFSSTPVILPKDTSTRYLSDNLPTSTLTFDLQSLLFAYLKRDAAVVEYMTGVREIGMGFVSIIERKVVVDWLTGKSALEGPKGRIIPLEEDSHEKEKDETMDAKESVEEGQVLDTVVEKEREAPVAKRAKYFIDKEDQDRVRQMLRVVDGPSYATQGPDNRPVKDAVGYKTRATILRGERLNNFESARVIAKPRLDILKEQARLRGHDGAPAAGVAISSGGAVKPGKKKQLTPIILISPSSSALITMHNVKRFLEESIFESSDDVRRGDGTTAGRVAEDMVQVNHARSISTIASSLGGAAQGDGRKTRYFVVDSIEALAKFGGTDEAWERVVCVMTTGQEWQFTPYKWKEPKELFHHVKGVFVQWTHDAPNMKVRSWNVTELRVDPAKRHIDKSTVADFWRSLESWISIHKPWLSY